MDRSTTGYRAGHDQPARARAWTITDPSAPGEPEVPAGRALPQAPARSLGRRRASRFFPVPPWVLCSAAVVVAPVLPQAPADWLLDGLGLFGMSVQVPVVVVRAAAALVLVVAAAGPGWWVLRWAAWRTAAAWSRRAVAARLDAHGRHWQWSEQYQLRREQLPRGPVREHADRAVVAIAALESSRACREGWVDDGWARTLQARQWSLLTRERASAAVRAQLAEADTLAEHDARLAGIASDRVAEIAALDADLAALAEQSELLRDLARDLDAELAAADETRALRDRAAALAQRLGGDPLTGDDRDAWPRRLRDQVLAEGGPGDDLTILAAQLRALVQHVARDTGAARPR
uniref:hypothetical protein n=1 Tax=Amycolatopsis sp. CA-096443 TaxID=3239919 RepID=UPI003F49343A